jgi:hypothetical protein
MFQKMLKTVVQILGTSIYAAMELLGLPRERRATRDEDNHGQI